MRRSIGGSTDIGTWLARGGQFVGWGEKKESLGDERTGAGRGIFQDLIERERQRLGGSGWIGEGGRRRVSAAGGDRTRRGRGEVEASSDTGHEAGVNKRSKKCKKRMRSVGKKKCALDREVADRASEGGGANK
jgi:hypothetical protein